MDYITKIIIENKKYSTKKLQVFLFDLDEKIITNYYFKNRDKFKIKTGKYERVSYYLLCIMYPNVDFTSWFIENRVKSEHKIFLELLLKRIELSNLIVRRIKNKDYLGSSTEEHDIISYYI